MGEVIVRLVDRLTRYDRPDRGWLLDRAAGHEDGLRATATRLEVAPSVDPGMSPIDPARSSRFLFVHIMKTAGTNFLTQFRQLFPARSVWPVYRPDRDATMDDWPTISNYMSLAPLASMSQDELHSLLLVAGHVPFAAAELLRDGDPEQLSCLTLLRVLSSGRCRFSSSAAAIVPSSTTARSRPSMTTPGISIDSCHDHQTRVFSMTLEEATAPRTDQVLFSDFLKSMIPVSASSEERSRVEAMIRDDQVIPEESTLDVVAELERLGVDMANHKPAYEVFERQPKYWVPEGGMGYLYADATLTRPSPVNDDRLGRARDNLDRCASRRPDRGLSRFHRGSESHL